MSEELAAPRGVETPGETSSGDLTAAHVRESRRTRALVLSTAGVCFALFWYTGGLLGIPAHYGHDASLLRQPGSRPIISIVISAVLLFFSAIFAQTVAGRRWGFAGVFCAALGLSAWSYRGGPSSDVYRQAASDEMGRSIYLVLLLELTILVGFVGAIWFWIVRRVEAVWAAGAGIEPSRPNLASVLQLVGLQALVIAFAATFFVQSDAKGTATIALFIVSFAATGLVEFARSHWFPNDRVGAWYWAGPLVAGALGYLTCYISGGNESLMVGQPGGWFPALARPLPLDYATAGILGALLGYWTGVEHPVLSVGGLLMPLRGVHAAGLLQKNKQPHGEIHPHSPISTNGQPE